MPVMAYPTYHKVKLNGMKYKYGTDEVESKKLK